MKYSNKNIYFFVIAFLTITNFNAQNLASLIEKYNENKNDESIILEIGKKSEAYQRSRFAFAGKHCNLNAKALGDK